jgi:hypothetical protein
VAVLGFYFFAMGLVDFLILAFANVLDHNLFLAILMGLGLLMALLVEGL